jgi:serpin B
MAASAADARRAAGATNAFGFELLRGLRLAGSNAVVSPASIVLALGMARAGARGTTATEMDEVLGGLGSPKNAAWLAGLDAVLASRSTSAKDADGVAHDLVLRIANAPFAQRDMAIEPAYLAALGAQYGAGLRIVDYRGDSEAARRVINGWVDVQTAHRIKELLAQRTINSATRLTLVNAIYLKAPWQVPFDPQATKPGMFTTAGGRGVQVPFMTATGTLPYATGDGWSAVDVAYLGDTMSLTLILPADLTRFEAALDGVAFGRIVDAMAPHAVQLALPKFAIETHRSLVSALQAIGMRSPFDASVADFSGISREALVISDVIHQANITIDEAGTEAAAATAVVIGDTAGPAEPVAVRLDRPFAFALRDRETGAILFLGHVTDPSAD